MLEILPAKECRKTPEQRSQQAIDQPEAIRPEMQAARKNSRQIKRIMILPE